MIVTSVVLVIAVAMMAVERLRPGGAIAGYLVITFIYYWWHRARHESGLQWPLHQRRR